MRSRAICMTVLMLLEMVVYPEYLFINAACAYNPVTIKDCCTQSGFDVSKEEQWAKVPQAVKDKLIEEEIAVHPEIEKTMEMLRKKYCLMLGDAVGAKLGEIAAQDYKRSWIWKNIVEAHECIIWGNVEKDFKKRDMTTVKAGDYLMMYKLGCHDAVLIWGPVAGTDQDHINAGMTPGSRYKKDALVLDLSRNEYVHARPT